MEKRDSQRFHTKFSYTFLNLPTIFGMSVQPLVFFTLNGLIVLNDGVIMKRGSRNFTNSITCYSVISIWIQFSLSLIRVEVPCLEDREELGVLGWIKNSIQFFTESWKVNIRGKILENLYFSIYESLRSVEEILFATLSFYDIVNFEILNRYKWNSV